VLLHYCKTVLSQAFAAHCLQITSEQVYNTVYDCAGVSVKDASE